METLTLKAILLDALARFTSRKFWSASASFVIVLLGGLGHAEFPETVQYIAAANLVAYVGVDGVIGAIKARNGGGGGPGG